MVADGASPVVVVENGAPGSVARVLDAVSAGQPAANLRLVQPGRNVGFGAGVNRGLAALAGEPEPPDYVLV
jgi:GT2 family glycosyltransferase